MKPSREESVPEHRTVRSNSAEYPSASQGASHLIQQQHHYQPYQHAGERRSLSKPSENSSPPPHLSVTTTATSGTPSSSESMRSVSEGDQQRLSSGPISSSSAPSPISSSVPLSSAPSDQSASWNPPQQPLVPARAQPPGNPSDLPEPDTVYDQGGSEARYSAASFPAAIKLLVSNNVAGSIIGRSGQTISDLQAQSATRIKLSQAGDYYPGTQDRVCLVQGQAENVKRAVNMLLTRLYALQQQQHYHHFAWQRQQQERGLMHETMFGAPDPSMHPPIIPGFSFVVRILVPVPCCGMIIGKGGTNIKQMVDSSGVSSVRLSPKESSDPDAPFQPGATPAASAALISATAERVVSITGPDLNSCLNCLHIILDGMTSHPDISRYANMTTSYTRVISAAQTAFAGPQSPVSSAPGVRRPEEGVENLLGGQADDFGAQIKRSSSQGYLDRHMSGPTHSAPLLRPSPSPVPTAESMGPYQVFGGQPSPFLHQEHPPRNQVQTMQTPVYLMPGIAQQSSFSGGPTIDDGIALPPSQSAPDLLALQMQNSLRVSDPMEGSAMGYTPAASTSFAHQIPQPTHSPPGFAAQIAIADNLIGSILGRGGRTLNELQVLSNTRIRISQRGEFLPGTKNRVVTIRGPTAQSVSTAQFLMNQRMVLPPTASTFMERPDYGVGPYPDYRPPHDHQHPPQS